MMTDIQLENVKYSILFGQTYLTYTYVMSVVYLVLSSVE